MPGFDRTGPMGAGPMSGGRMGLCGPGRTGTGRSSLGRYGFGFRSGYGRGGGFRRGFCRGFAWNPPAYGAEYPIDQTNELHALKVEADFMKNALDSINQRIKELEKSSD